jgi:hypothetical protein
MRVDHLRTWLSVRAEVPWHRVRHTPVDAPRTPRRDGAVHDIRAFDGAVSPARSARLLAALELARADAGACAALTFERLTEWQRLVLDTSDTPSFRTGPAFAKAGQERYGHSPDLPALLDHCLAQSQDDDLPLPSRAARAFLDVCFFHPFDDGNARSAFLASTFILARAEVTLDQVGPVRRLRRRADDPEGALALADLIAVLINHSRQRGLGRGT